jgi:hypothetical protein
MCRIGINLTTTTPQDTTIVSAVGRYRIINSGNNWTTWSIIDINNPQTPDITIVGSYEVQLSVTNSSNVTSDWAESTFTVSTTCGQTAPTTSGTTSGVTTFSFGGACGTNIPTRTKFGTNDSLSDGCGFSLVVSNGSITLEASSFLNSGSALNTSFSITGAGSSNITNSVAGTTKYGSIITLAPGSYTGTFGYAYTSAQGTASVRVTTL